MKSIPTGLSIFLWTRAWTACGSIQVSKICYAVLAFPPDYRDPNLKKRQDVKRKSHISHPWSFTVIAIFQEPC